MKESLSDTSLNSWSNASCCLATVMVCSAPAFRCWVMRSSWDFAILSANVTFFGALWVASTLASTNSALLSILATLYSYPPPPALLGTALGPPLGWPWRYGPRYPAGRLLLFPRWLLKLLLFGRFPRRPFMCLFPPCILRCGCNWKQRSTVCVLLPQWVHFLFERSFFFLRHSASV